MIYLGVFNQKKPYFSDKKRESEILTPGQETGYRKKRKKKWVLLEFL